MRRPPFLRVLASLSAGLLALSTRAFAVTGVLSGAYGPPLAIQTSQSDVQGIVLGSDATNFSDLAQLDRAYGYIADGTLHLFIAGNVPFATAGEGHTVRMPLDLFFDCAPGGQHVLAANNPVLDYAGSPNDMSNLTGLTFDDGFAADYYLTCGALDFWPNFDVYLATLPAAGGGGALHLGTTTAGPPGTLSGGTNPDGVQATLDDSNNNLLPSGCGAAIDLAVPTGVELAIPLSALGNPSGCIRVTAFLRTELHPFTASTAQAITNQVLGPLPPGTCSIVPAGSMDFSAIAGDQFFTICPSITPVRPSTWGRVKVLYRQ